ncbi:MAG TPA: Flp pilus assembly protein CpaB [Candidatus Limnocylindrales bacterium]|nr:Flp pilus assembly protein CpaB [Candidatus Limnocylindrales bacterium]
MNTQAVATRRSSRRRAGLPFIIGGGALAVLTFLGVLFYTFSLSGQGAGNTPVVVAARDLQIRVPILPSDLTVVQYHAEDVPPGSFAKVTELTNVVAAVNISKGQPVTSNLVAASSDAVLGPQAAFLPIPTGFVALTIPTGEQIGVAGYIQVGDYISLVATMTGKTAVNVRTIYTNIPIIRIGTAPDVNPAQASPATPPKTGGISTSLTIVVTQCQAEYISWFVANGGLRYTLESYHDYQPQDKAVDASCPSVNAAGGVTQQQVAAKWPSLFS